MYHASFHVISYVTEVLFNSTSNNGTYRHRIIILPVDETLGAALEQSAAKHTHEVTVAVVIVGVVTGGRRSGRSELEDKSITCVNP